LASQLFGYSLASSGEIERHHLEPEGSILWGDHDKERGTPVWLQPDRMYRSHRGYFVFLNDTDIETLIPGAGKQERSMERINRAAKEQAAKNLAMGSKGDPLVLRMMFAVGFIVITMIFMVISVAIALTKFA